MTHTYEYNAQGQLVSMRDQANNLTSYRWNARGQMTGMTLPTGSQAEYVYDENGHRTQQTVNGVETNYLWDEFSQYGDVVLETEPVTGDSTHYTLVNGRVLSQHENGLTSYLLGDAQNSTIALADAAGDMTAQYEYDAFGDLLDTSDTPDTNYLYTGQQYDPMSELYSLRARYYNPSQGRFLSRDEWAYNYQNPLELNRYVYTANNPVNYTDPSGNARALLETAQILKSAAIQAIQPVTSIGHFPLIAIGVTAVAFTCILLECWEWPGQAVEILNNLLQNHVEDQIDWEALFEEAGNAASWIIDLFARMLSNSAGRETGNESANENAEDAVDDVVEDAVEDEEDEPLDIVRHYTSRTSFNTLSSNGYTFTRFTGFVGGPFAVSDSSGIFFTDTLPFEPIGNRLYHPLRIMTALGIPSESAEYYIDVDREQLTQYPWYNRVSPTGSGKPEHIYVTGGTAVSIGHAVIRGGATEDLEMNNE